MVLEREEEAELRLLRAVVDRELRAGVARVLERLELELDLAELERWELREGVDLCRELEERLGAERV